jgi:hypothetical protein
VVEVVRVQESLMHVTPIWTQFLSSAHSRCTKIISMYFQTMYAELYTTMPITA